jgi:hypothetical protein
MNTTRKRNEPGPCAGTPAAGRRGLCRVALASLTAWAVLSPVANGASTGTGLVPGLYEWVLTVENGASPPLSLTERTCMADGELDPALFTQLQGDCGAIEFEEAGDAVTWTFECAYAGATGRGEGRAVSHGDTFETRTRLVLDLSDLGGGEMLVEQRFEGIRVGDCPAGSGQP